MFDMSWSELLLIAVIGLMVIGPKDLPRAIKTVAQFARKARSLAREFQSGLAEMAREAELEEVKRDIESAASTDLSKELEHSIDPGGEVTKSLDLQAETAAQVTPAGPAPSEPVVTSSFETGASALPPDEVTPTIGGFPHPDRSTVSKDEEIRPAELEPASVTKS
jgi:sec-independent protein translocase protein TatB